MTGWFWMKRFGLLVALIPLGVATIQLAKLPGRLNSAQLSPDGKFALTSYADDEEQDRVTVRLLSLETGETTSLVATYGWFTGDECFAYVNFFEPTIRIFKFDRDSFRFREVASHATEAKYVHYEPPDFFAYIEGGKLIVTNVRTGTTATSSFAGSTASEFDVHGLTLASSATRWLVSEYSNGATGGRESQTLFALDEAGELKQLATWPAADWPRSDERNDRIYSITADLQLEIRRTLDGSLVETRPLQTVLGVKTGTKPRFHYLVDDELLAVNFAPNQEPIYDVRTRQVVFWNTADQRLDEAHDGLGFVRTNHSVEVLRLADKASLRKFHFDQAPHTVKLCDDGSLAILLDDESVRIYDMATGTLKRSFRDRWWVMPTVAVLMVGVAFWCWIWVKQSLRFDVHPVWDLAMIHAVLVGGLLARAALFLGDRNRYLFRFPLGTESAFVLGEGLLASWLALAMGWLVFGHRRWSIRATAPFFVSAAVILVVAAMYRGKPYATSSFLVAAAFMALAIGVCFALIRILGWRLAQHNDLHRSVRMPRTGVRLPLRDFFLIMAAVGAISAVIQFVPFAPYTKREIDQLVKMGSIAAVSAVTVWIIALNSRNWFWRAAAVAFVTLGMTSLPCYMFTFWLNWGTWLAVLRMMSALSISIWLSCWIFHLRGWYLVRVI
jgi:hypothetical protein